MAQRLKIPDFLQTRAAFEPDTFDEKSGTVEVVFTTGARGLRYSWDGPFYEELEVSERACDLSRLNNGAPYLDDHPYKRGEGGTKVVLGVVERAWLAGPAGKKEGRALIRFSERDEVKPIKRDVQTGILRHVSIGYSIQKMEKVAEVEKVPVLRATRWTPFEISQTPVAFDDQATVRSKKDEQFHEVEVSSTVQEENVMADPIIPDPTPKADPVADAARAASQARIEDAKVRAAEAEKIAQRAAADERDRVSEIRSTVLRHLPGARGEALAQEYVDKNVSVTDVRAAVLNILAGEDAGSVIDGHVRFEAGEDKRDKFVRGAAASIFERSGHSEMIAAAKGVKRLAVHLRDAETDSGEFGGMKLLDLARAALEMRGQSTRGLYGEALIQRALAYRDGGMNTTSDFAVLLETAVNKIFLGRYATIPVTWPSWCARKSVQDFRTTTFYRPGTFGKLDSVSEAGEIKHKNIPDGSKAQLTPASKGNLIGITRRSIVNDDLGVFRDLASGLGEAAALTIESDAWALFAANGLGANAPDGVALFNAAHNNIGTTGAMSVATLDSIRAKMALQKDASGNVYISYRPSILLVPVELGGTAKVFNTSTGDPTDSKNAGVANKVLNLFPGGIIDSPYLSALSSTRHYGLADPNLLPVFAVGFIDGQEAPRIDSQEVFGFEGLMMKVALDYGTAVLDYRGAVTCAGQ